MSTKTHDDRIKKIVEWAKLLGYGVVECNLGTKTGADAVFENQFNEKVMLEVVTGSSFKELFQKPRIRKEFVRVGTYWVKPEILGLIIVADKITNVKDHGIEVGLPAELFDPPKQRIFPVLTDDYKSVIPVLLVSLLGSRASAYARWA